MPNSDSKADTHIISSYAPPKSYKATVLVLVIIFVIAILAASIWWMAQRSSTQEDNGVKPTNATTAQITRDTTRYQQGTDEWANQTGIAALTAAQDGDCTTAKQLMQNLKSANVNNGEAYRAYSESVGQLCK